MRLSADLVPGSAHGAGEEMLWTGLHGLVSLYNDHGAPPRPPLDELLATILSLHTRLPAVEIARVLSDEASAGPPTPDRGGR